MPTGDYHLRRRFQDADALAELPMAYKRVVKWLKRILGIRRLEALPVDSVTTGQCEVVYQFLQTCEMLGWEAAVVIARPVMVDGIILSGAHLFSTRGMSLATAAAVCRDSDGSRRKKRGSSK